MTERNVKYQGLSFPVPVIEMIKAHIKTRKQYTSVTNFIRYAITEKIEREVHPSFIPKDERPPALSQDDKEVDAFLDKYVDKDFKDEFERKTKKIYWDLIKKSVKKVEKEERKKKN